MAYFAYTDVETFLNLTLQASGINLVNALIPAIEEYTDKHCNRTWKKAAGDDITEYYDGDESELFVNYPPIASVTSLKVGKTAQYAGDTLTTDDYWIYSTYIKLNIKKTYAPRSVELVYRTSANSVPADLKHALIRWCADIFKSQEVAGKTVQSISAGPVNMSFLVQDGIPKFVQMALDNYKLNPGV